MFENNNIRSMLSLIVGPFLLLLVLFTDTAWSKTAYFLGELGTGNYCGANGLIIQSYEECNDARDWLGISGTVEYVKDLGKPPFCYFNGVDAAFYNQEYYSVGFSSNAQSVCQASYWVNYGQIECVGNNIILTEENCLAAAVALVATGHVSSWGGVVNKNDRIKGCYFDLGFVYWNTDNTHDKSKNFELGVCANDNDDSQAEPLASEYKGKSYNDAGHATNWSTLANAGTNYYSGGRPDLRAGYGTTNRSGFSSMHGLAAPDPIMGVSFNPGNPNNPKGFRDGIVNYANGATIGGNNASYYHGDVLFTDTRGHNTSEQTHGTACSARGFKCDFAEKARMGPYKPLDFIWKVVDPLDYNKTEANEMRTLNCEVDISAGDFTNQKGGEYFYVPIGQENVGSTDYCDIESIRRVINDASLNMTDTIVVRGETARLNNQESATSDLIGDMFDVICTCTTELQAEAAIDLTTTTLLSRMESTGQTRQMEVEIILYHDAELKPESVVSFNNGDEFPKASPAFYFLVRHMLDNDWDVQLQISKCVACAAGENCNSYTPNTNAVIFYEACDTVIGGPQYRPVANTSWYSDPTVYTPYKNTTGKWSDINPDHCPYHALGFQKFRIQGTNAMKISCAITACYLRPCSPCVGSPGYPLNSGDITRRHMVRRRNRRLLGIADRSRPKVLERKLQHEAVKRVLGTQNAKNERALQGTDPNDPSLFEEVEIGTRIRFGDFADGTAGDDASSAGANKGKSREKAGKKNQGTNIFMVLILLVMALGSLLAARHAMKNHEHANKKRTVQDGDESIDMSEQISERQQQISSRERGERDDGDRRHHSREHRDDRSRRQQR